MRRPRIGRQLVRGVFQLQDVTTLFRFGSDTKLRIMLGEFQERLCIDGWYMNFDCDLKTRVDLFSGGFISL